MAKRRRMSRLRRDVARLYHFEPSDLEWEALNSFDPPSYNSGDFTTAFTKSESYMPTTNL